MLSDYQLKIAADYNVSIVNVKKLIPDFFDKGKYVLHYKNLKFWLRFKIKKLHRVLELEQSKWLKPYINFNAQKWIKAEKNGDKNGKAFFKLMNKDVYNQTM